MNKPIRFEIEAICRGAGHPYDGDRRVLTVAQTADRRLVIVETAASNEGPEQPMPLELLQYLDRLIAWNWDDEQADFCEQFGSGSLAALHIFRDLVALDNWLHRLPGGHRTPESYYQEQQARRAGDLKTTDERLQAEEGWSDEVSVKTFWTPKMGCENYTRPNHSIMETRYLPGSYSAIDFIEDGDQRFPIEIPVGGYVVITAEA